MERNSFVFYDSFYKAISKLQPEEQSLCLKALCDYCFKGVVPDNDNPIVSMFFELIKPQIDTNNKRYENGCKGGRPSKPKETKIKPNDNQKKPNNNQTETKAKPKETKPKPNDNVNDNDNDNVNDNDNIKRENNIKEKSLAVVETTALTPQAEVFEIFAKLYKQATNIEYLGKQVDYINLAKLIKKYGKELVIRKIKWLLIGCKNSVFWFSKDINDFTISTLTTHWDRILPKLTEDQKKEENRIKAEQEQKNKIVEELKKQGIELESKGGLCVIR